MMHRNGSCYRFYDFLLPYFRYFLLAEHPSEMLKTEWDKEWDRGTGTCPKIESQWGQGTDPRPKPNVCGTMVWYRTIVRQEKWDRGMCGTGGQTPVPKLKVSWDRGHAPDTDLKNKPVSYEI